MAGDTVVEVTSGPSGTGKSYSRVGCFIVKEWIPDFEGTLYTNVNLGRVPDDHTHPPEPWTDDYGRNRTRESFIRRICNYAAKKHGGDPADYAKRVRRIPPSVYDDWRDGRAGPWHYFRDIDIDGAHIQIDEIHVFCPAGGPAKRPEMWQRWLGEIRHEGATVEFMTQHLHKLNKKLYNEAALRRTLHSWGSMRDPFFRIPVFDWYELVAAFWSGKYQIPTVVTERVRKDERFVQNHRSTFKLDPFYFRFFNSFQQSNHGGKKGTKRKRQFEKRTKPGLLWWFVRKHMGVLAGRFAIVAAVGWLCFGGGVTLLLTGFMALMATTANANAPKIEPQAVAQVDTTPDQNTAELFSHGRPETTPYVPIDPTQPSDEFEQTMRVVEAQEQQQTDREAAMLAELQELREHAERMEAEAQRVQEQRLKASAVVLVTPTEVTFREGYSYEVGDTIDYGIYAGHVVTAINYGRRAVILDDEIVLRMGRPNGVVTPPSVSAETDAD